HVVVLMMENRAFDHIFGYRAGVNGLKGDEFNLLDPTQPESDKNPAYSVSNGAPYAVLAGQGPGHSFEVANVQLCNSKAGPTPANPATNNGFVSNYHTELVYADHIKNATPEIIRVVMESFAPNRLPSINALADAFCLCDNWYSEVPGPTQPNRLYMHAATSFGYAHNVWTKVFDGPTIYNRFQDAGYTWATYSFDDNEVLEFSQVNQQKANFKLYENAFAADVQAGNLANYSFIMPQYNNATNAMANSQHAPQDARYGDNFIADVYETLRSNEAVWNKSVLIVTYDEHGGFYDHVVPPAQGIPNPDGINSPPPGDTASYALPVFDFGRLGFRVPAIIASPWIKAGQVDSTRYQHTSVLATVKKMFGLEDFLTKRDASANTFEQLFQELESPRTDTPAKLPRAPLPQITVSADHPAHPANQPLDSTQRDVMMRAYSLTQSSHPEGPPLDALPRTQGEAFDFIRKRYAKHFGLDSQQNQPDQPATKKPSRRRSR
ncbi:MAG: alkaline phosphatase family protein, partial [Armatimonadota bacterium]|nr:alkaline phosphatase family protein [Armatimonadota bacterium]